MAPGLLRGSRTSFHGLVIAFVIMIMVGASRGADLRWLAGDLHTHSRHSWDAAQLGGDPVARCLRLAEKQRLDFVSITDHQSVDAQADPAFNSASLTPIPGEESSNSSS